MANSKDNLSKYGKAFIGFDEPSGNVMDSIGGYTGALVNTPTRVTGWNGKGSAMSFNGTNQYITMNNKIIPNGTFTIRLKIKFLQLNRVQYIFGTNDNNTTESNTGVYLTLMPNDTLRASIRSSTTVVDCLGTEQMELNKWYDILFVLDESKNNDNALLYVNNSQIPYTKASIATKGVRHFRDLVIGNLWSNTAPTADFYFKGELDQMEIYDRVISLIPDKYLVQHNSDYKYHNGTDWQSTTPTEENFIEYGMNNLNHIKENQWKELSGDKSVAMWSDFEDKQFTSIVLNKNEFKPQDLLGDKPQAIY
ncbi:hypothetical protein B1B04_24900, partial [Lysinibacillus sp. KCTC 33748]|uniref:LamG domain-containing protein n=1 Tax=unclassified Lysinibacillus TaxID=2636778 RepID=UPI0009A8BD3F